MGELERFDDAPTPVEVTPEPVGPSKGSRTIAWIVLGLGAIYLLNPLFGVDIIPDNLPGVGNLDETAVVLIVLGALRYLNIELPGFIEKWISPARQLPADAKRDEE
jgi:hypothetical protein